MFTFVMGFQYFWHTQSLDTEEGVLPQEPNFEACCILWLVMILSNYSQEVESTESKSRHASFQVGFKYLDYDHCSNRSIFHYCLF